MAMRKVITAAFVTLAIIVMSQKTVASETEFECGAGHIIAGVALKGRIVKLAK